MGGFDLVIAAVFLISILIGIMRGFIREALSIASWIFAVWLAVTFCEAAGDFISQFISIPAEGFRTAAGFALVFIGTLFLFSVISYFLTKLLSKGAVKGADRVLGAGFGVVRGIAIMVIIFLAGRGMGMENNDWWQNSKYIGQFQTTADYVEKMLPSQLRSSAEATSDSPLDSVNESEITTPSKG